MKKFTALALVAMVVALAAGCNLFQVNPQRDAQLVVASVNGEYIYKEAINKVVSYNYDASYTATELQQILTQRETALEQLIADRLVVQAAREAGMFEFTPEDLEDIETAYKGYIDPVYNSSLQTYQTRADEGEDIDPEALANEDVDTYLSWMGTDREDLRVQLEESHAAQKLYDQAVASATTAPEQVENYYQTQLTSQQSTYASTPTQIITDLMSTSKPVICYMPEGVIWVKHILVGFDSTIANEIRALRQAGDDEAADKMMTDSLPTIQARAEEVLQKVNDGQDFDALIAEYNTDTGADSYPDGYPTMPGYEGYMPNFQNAAMTLANVGDNSILVPTDAGYHILKLAKKETAGVVSMADVQTEIEDALLAQERSTLWNDKVLEIADAATVKRYIRRLGF